MLFDQNRLDAIIHNWKNQVFSNEKIHGIPQRHSTCLKPPIGGLRNLASSPVKSVLVLQVVYIHICIKQYGQRYQLVGGGGGGNTF